MFVWFVFSVGKQKCTGHFKFDHVGAKTGEQGKANQPSGGQRVTEPKLQQPVSHYAVGVYAI